MAGIVERAIDAVTTPGNLIQSMSTLTGRRIAFVVTGAQHYGVLIRTDSGERGWVEAEYISETMLPRQDWPPVGTHLRGLVLGHAGDCRIRVCLRDVDGRPSPDLWPPVRPDSR
jgi:hypothetical protein